MGVVVRRLGVLVSFGCGRLRMDWDRRRTEDRDCLPVEVVDMVVALGEVSFQSLVQSPGGVGFLVVLFLRWDILGSCGVPVIFWKW